MGATLTASGVTPNPPRLEFDPATHRYFLADRELISVTTALRAAGMVDVSFFTEEARQRGEYVHEAIALDARGELEPGSIHPDLEAYFAAFRSFLSDSRVTIEHCERIVCDARLGYAGTLDAIVIWPGGKRTLIDHKSGAFPPMAGPQTAAYLRCARDWYPTGTVIGRAGLQLRGDGTYRYWPLNDIVQDEHDFLSALRVAQFRRRHAIQ